MRLAIYVVDDILMVGEATARMLRKLGHDVTVETEAALALDRLLGPDEIDLTILDLVMPDLTGAVIYEQCERSAPARCQRIMFLTGFAGMAPEWLRRSGRLTLEKPVDFASLKSACDAYEALRSPRGPTYPDRVPRPRASGRRLNQNEDTPREIPRLSDDFGEEEITSITRLAKAGDPLGMAVHDLRRDRAAISERVGAIEEQVRELVEGDMRTIRDDVHQIKNGFTLIKTLVPIIAVIIGGLVALIEIIRK